MMHPEIIKFWQEAGWHIPSPHRDCVTGYKATTKGSFILRIETLSFDNRYRFHGKWYSEEEMLRIIKQKAFL